MTAEIAILNKSAVALATDSAITISAGNQAQKVFDTADKLFELSVVNPIGIMVYNGMHFMGIPFQSIIKDFRAKRTSFDKVNDAADMFLDYLNQLGVDAPKIETDKTITMVVDPIFHRIDMKIKEEFFNRMLEYERSEKTAPIDSETIFEETINKIIEQFYEKIQALGKGKFLGNHGAIKFSRAETRLIGERVDMYFPGIGQSKRRKLIQLAKNLLNSAYMSGSKTGLIFAGFGSKERFPTLVSFEIEGVFGNRLKYLQTEKCDIDRSGERAFVRPFAQKEMVDRFLYGLDNAIQYEIMQYCRKTIGTISNEIFKRLYISDQAKKDDLLDRTKAAEETFLRNLQEQVFSSIESSSRKEIEDMVEFMPKPELAKMAEALIDLTSIKRKVSRGLETVGGPVDVAVISKSEGFVWVKRKHYFPPELNVRYFERLRTDTHQT